MSDSKKYKSFKHWSIFIISTIMKVLYLQDLTYLNCVLGMAGCTIVLLNLTLKKWWKKEFPLNTFIICCLFSFLACICLGVLTLTFHEGSNDKTLLLFVYFVTTCFVFLSVIVNGVFSYFIQELQQMYPPSTFTPPKVIICNKDVYYVEDNNDLPDGDDEDLSVRTIIDEPPKVIFIKEGVV